jgi:hypothetical protein
VIGLPRKNALAIWARRCRFIATIASAGLIILLIRASRSVMRVLGIAERDAATNATLIRRPTDDFNEMRSLQRHRPGL